MMRRIRIGTLAAAVALGCLRADDFQCPPHHLRPFPLLFLNGQIFPESASDQIRSARQKAAFGGIVPFPQFNTLPRYLSDAYFAKYQDILKFSRDAGMEVVFYDDCGIPSGAAGGRFEKVCPNDTGKNLDMWEFHVQGPVDFSQKIPPGTLMAAVAWNVATQQRLDISSSAKDGKLTWKAPAGTWKVLIFVCARADSGALDFFSQQAVEKFLTLTYDEYFKRFPDEFGPLIRRNLFLEAGPRDIPHPWTSDFNQKFEERFGTSPATMYPALWRDIGPSTESTRIQLFSFLADLAADAYPAKVSQWCKAHRILNSGQPAGANLPCPVDSFGDPFKFFRDVDIPVISSTQALGAGRPAFKLTSSAAVVFGRRVVAAEAFGLFAEKSLDPAMLYRNSLELFSRGANLLMVRGMWMDSAHVGSPPLISHLNPKLLPALPDFNSWAARCCLELQAGRPVADIAIVYPIAAMQAWFRFDLPEKSRGGKFTPPEIDYLAVGDTLTRHLRRDFTFLPPDVIANRCTNADGQLRLTNASGPQVFRALILPGGKVISWPCLEKIHQFLLTGGKVVATTCLPQKSAEPGHDADVRRTIEAMFGKLPDKLPLPPPSPLRIKISLSGDTIKTYVDGALVDQRTDPSLVRGGIGFRENDHENATVANVRVTGPDGKLDFDDNFTGGLDRWLNVGNAAATDRHLAVPENQFPRTRGGEAWGNYSFEADLLSTSGRAGFAFRVADENNFYLWQLSPSTHELVLQKRVDSQWQILGTVVLPEVDESVFPYSTKSHPGGGLAFFAPTPSAGTLREILQTAMPVPDIGFDPNLKVCLGGGSLTSLHRIDGGRHIFFFANSTDEPVETTVRLRGKFDLQILNPHDGTTSPALTSSDDLPDRPITSLHLKIPPLSAVFAVSKTQ